MAVRQGRGAVHAITEEGKIINISSNVALTGNPNYIHYVTSKGAIIAMTRAMARELGDWNICVNTVTPGFVVTDGRQVDPEYEKLRAQQRSIKRSQSKPIWSARYCF